MYLTLARVKWSGGNTVGIFGSSSSWALVSPLLSRVYFGAIGVGDSYMLVLPVWSLSTTQHFVSIPWHIGLEMPRLTTSIRLVIMPSLR